MLGDGLDTLLDWRVRVPSDPGSPPCDGEGGRERRTLQGRCTPTGRNGLAFPFQGRAASPLCRSNRSRSVRCREPALKDARRGPVCKDLVHGLGDCVRTCTSSPFNDGRWVTRSSHLDRRHITSSRREIFPPHACRRHGAVRGI
jgi:hypothetical protein